MNEAIGNFTSPINGAIIESKAEVETQAFTIGMNKNVFVGLSEDLFVNSQLMDIVLLIDSMSKSKRDTKNIDRQRL